MSSAGPDSPPSEEAFRQEVLTFLRTTLPAKGDEASGVISFGGSGLPAFGRLPGPTGRRRPGRHHVAGRVRGAWSARSLSAHLSTGRPEPSGYRPARWRSASACAGPPCWCTPARSRRRRTSHRCSVASTCGANSSASRARARTCPACRRERGGTATSSSSRARRSGRRARSTAITRPVWCARTRRGPSARASRC